MKRSQGVCYCNNFGQNYQSRITEIQVSSPQINLFLMHYVYI